MRRGRQLAKPDVGRRLDGRVRARFRSAHAASRCLLAGDAPPQGCKAKGHALQWVLGVHGLCRVPRWLGRPRHCALGSSLQHLAEWPTIASKFPALPFASTCGISRKCNFNDSRLRRCSPHASCAHVQVAWPRSLRPSFIANNARHCLHLETDSACWCRAQENELVDDSQKL